MVTGAAVVDVVEVVEVEDVAGEDASDVVVVDVVDVAWLAPDELSDDVGGVSVVAEDGPDVPDSRVAVSTIVDVTAEVVVVVEPDAAETSGAMSTTSRVVIGTAGSPPRLAAACSMNDVGITVAGWSTRSRTWAMAPQENARATTTVTAHPSASFNQFDMA